MTKKRRISMRRCAVGIGSAITLMIACSSIVQAAEADSGRPVTSQDLADLDEGYTADSIRLMQTAIESLDPMGDNVFYGMDEVYEFLYGYDGVGGETYAILADEDRGEFGGYDHEEGTGDYTIYIYDSIYDHNGNHITADDVVFSYNYRNENYSNSWAAFESVEAIDDTTCLFHFSRELTGISEFSTYFYGVYIVSEASFEASESNLITEMCGTGPYKFVSYTPGSSLKLTRNEDYWQKDESKIRQWQKANVENIEFVINAESAQQVVALKTEEADLVNSVDQAYIEDLTAQGYKIYDYDANMVMFLLPNCDESSIVSDENLRKAIFYALDNKGVESAYQGTTTAVNVIGLDTFSDWDDSWDTMESYCNICDLELSKKYLEKSSYNGEKIKLMCMAVDIFSLSAQILQNQLVEAGFNVELVPYDPPTFFSMMAEPEEWDLLVNCVNAFDYNAVFWQQIFDPALTTDGRTKNFIDDTEWMQQLDNILLEEGHTIENMTQWWDYAIEHAYVMPVQKWNTNLVYSSDVKAMALNYGNIYLPGSFVYEAK